MGVGPAGQFGGFHRHVVSDDHHEASDDHHEASDDHREVYNDRQESFHDRHDGCSPPPSPASDDHYKACDDREGASLSLLRGLLRVVPRAVLVACRQLPLIRRRAERRRASTRTPVRPGEKGA